MKQQEVSVYMFLGFLDSGKSQFIQETLEDPRMENGEKTMLLVCEEGEVEYEPKKFAVNSVAIVTLEDKSELNIKNLEALTKKHDVSRVVVEFNGTWMLDDFFNAMPDNWVINQMMTFFDANTFLNYNQNMRQLTYDKIQMTQMVVFNRFRPAMDKMEFHKIARAISRRVDIVYEWLGGKPEFDDIEDPLPFDINADIIKIEDDDFALFLRDIGENPQQYIGKKVAFKGMVAVSKKIVGDTVVIGRYIMTCCEADIAYDGLALNLNGLIKGLKTKDWITVTAQIDYGFSPVYKEEGPVLQLESVSRCNPPEQIVVTY